jgi:glycosyltransferase involved in cell wall biosynthesis
VVSIILPTYNRAALLTASIGSVLQQEGVDFELIVIDDGSEDDTREVVLSMGDRRIKYFHLPHTGYTSRMKNFAIGQSSGDYLAFIDSDDQWTDGKLRRQWQLLAEHPEVGFSITDMKVYRGDQVLKDHTYGSRGGVAYVNIFPWLVRNQFQVYNPTLVLRRPCLERTGLFNETMRSGDHDFNMRLAYHFQAAVLYEPLLRRRLHAGQMSEEMAFDNYQEYLSTFADLYAAQMIRRGELYKAQANAHVKLGWLYARAADKRAARRHFISALQHDPWHARWYLSLAKTVFPLRRNDPQ